MARRSKKIIIKNAAQIAKMRIAGDVASAILQETAAFIQIGRTTLEVDRFAKKQMDLRGCTSAFFNYRGFPAQTCLSLNEQVVHGIGSEREIVEGDLVSIDIGIRKDGWIGDNAMTVPVGKINGEQKRLLAATEESLFRAIEFAREGIRLAELCGAVDEFVTQFGFEVVLDLVGHGVGSDLHEEPQVPNYRPRGKTPVLQAGMVLAIEPMVNAGTGEVDFLKDGWTVVTKDRRPSAHFEHTVLITKGEAEILTPRPRTALPSQLGIPPMGEAALAGQGWR